MNASNWRKATGLGGPTLLMPIQMDRKRKKRCAADLIWVGRASDKAAAATGMSRRTLEKAQAIIDAAEADPEKFGSDTRHL